MSSSFRNDSSLAAMARFPLLIAEFFLIFSLCPGLDLETSAKQPPRYVIKFATVAPEGSTWMKQMRTITQAIEDETNGRVIFRIYAGGVAGDELEILKKIRMRQLQCAAFSGVGFGKILPEVRVLDLPFLFRSYEEVDRALRRLKPYFSQHFREKGFILLNWAEVGNVYVFSKRPIRVVGDFRKSKAWSWAGDPIAKETFSALGVTPITLPVTDVTTALSTGLVDTVYAPPLGLLALQWHPYVKYMNALPFAHSTGALLLSSRTWEKLPQQLGKFISSEFEKSMSTMTSQLRQQNEEAIDVLKNHGITIIPEPTGQALQKFDAIHRRVASALSGKIYSYSLLKQLYGILGRNTR